MHSDFFREITAVKFQVPKKYKGATRKLNYIQNRIIMGKNDKYKYMRSISIPLHQEDRIALEERQSRLQKVLEQRRSWAPSLLSGTAGVSVTGSAEPEVDGVAVLASVLAA